MDPNSFANLTQAVQTHAHLSLTVSFAKKTLSGTCTLTATILRETVTTLVLDTKLLTIHSVVDAADNNKLAFSLADNNHEAFGRALTIAVPEKYRKTGGVIVTLIEINFFLLLNQSIT
jgi:aminopeptidase N